MIVCHSLKLFFFSSIFSRGLLNSPCVEGVFLKGVDQTTDFAVSSVCTDGLWILDVHLSDKQMQSGRFDVYLN